MSFFATATGEQINGTNDFEIDGGGFAPIPSNTQLIALIEDVKWDHARDNDDTWISIKWRVASPAEYKNRIVFHKLKVDGTAQDKDPVATAEKAKRMLAAIDTNAGGKLQKSGKVPTDIDLMSALAGRLMAIKVQVWEMNDKTGNWVSAVAPAKGSAAATQPQTPPRQSVQQAQAAAQAQIGTSFEDDIPF